jgi:hypothetical protein
MLVTTRGLRVSESAQPMTLNFQAEVIYPTSLFELNVAKDVDDDSHANSQVMASEQAGIEMRSWICIIRVVMMRSIENTPPDGLI